MLLSFMIYLLLFKLILTFVSVLCCMIVMVVLDTRVDGTNAARDRPLSSFFVSYVDNVRGDQAYSNFCMIGL